MQTELLSLNGVSQDSAKLLSEKLSLTRELTLLKPEVEHLRSQLAHQKEVLAEKLALERQLNALEVELANEKRSAQRAQQRTEPQDDEAEEELRQQVESLQKQLADAKRAKPRGRPSRGATAALEQELRDRVDELEKELAAEKKANKKGKKDQDDNTSDAEAADLRKVVKDLEDELANARREQQKAQKEHERALAKAVADVQSEKELIEERFVELRTRLKDTRTELKSTKAELMALQQGPVTAAEEDEVPKKLTHKLSTKSLTGKTQVRRKRRANEMSEEPAVLATPEVAEARQKRPLKKKIEATLTEKSTFSITPFLNKTMNFADQSVSFHAGGDPTMNMPEPTIPFSMSQSQSQSQQDISTASVSVSVPVSQEAPEPTVQITTQTETTKVPVKGGPKPRGRPPKAKTVLGDASDSTKNSQPTSRKLFSESTTTLDQVMEDTPADVSDASEDEENTAPRLGLKAKDSMPSLALKAKDSMPSLALKAKNSMPNLKAKDSMHTLKSKASSATLAGDATGSFEAEPKKKKRKLLGGGGGGGSSGSGMGKTLFGDGGDDEDEQPKKRRPGLGGVRSLAKGVARGAFGGGFSPLKRDKRGVGASFLA
jgi:hypothetical protein